MKDIYSFIMPYFTKWKEAIKGITPKVEIPDVEVPEMKVPDFPIPDTPITAIIIPETSAIQIPQGSVEMVEPISVDIEALKSIIPDIETPVIPDKLERDIIIPKTDIPDIRVLPPPEELKRYIPIPKVDIPDIRVLPLPEQLKRMVSISETIIPDISIQEMAFPINYIREIGAILKPSMPIISIPVITEYNIFKQVQELKKWKEEFANPNILSNIGNIESIYNDIKNNMIPNIEANIKNITSIYNDLKNNVAPNINKAKDLAISAMESSIINMNNISSIYTDLKDNIAPSVNKAKDLAISAMETSIINMDNISAVYTELRDNIVPTINKAKEVALLAADNAQKAVDYAKAFILKLQLAGEVIAYGIEDLTINAKELYRTITMEVGELTDSYIDFGLTIQSNAGKIVTELKELGAEMVEFIYEIRPALNASARNAKSAGDAGGKLRGDISSTLHDIEDLEFGKAANHLRDFRSHIDTFADDGMDALAYLLYRGSDGQGAVIPELLEGIEEIGREAAQLSSAVFDFGLNLYNSSNEIAKQNRYSFNAIRRQVNVFTNSFLRIFIDLNRVFTTEYTSQEIAEEQAIRRIERDKYIEFKDGLYQYDIAASDCEKGNQALVIEKKLMDDAYIKYQSENAYWEKQYAPYAVVENTVEYKRLVAENTRFKTSMAANEGWNLWTYGALISALRKERVVWKRRPNGSMYTVREFNPDASYYYLDRLGDVGTMPPKNCTAYPWICGTRNLVYWKYSNVSWYRGWDIYEANRKLFYYRKNYVKPYEAMMIKRKQIKEKWDSVNAINNTDYINKKKKYDATLKMTNEACTYKEDFHEAFVTKYNITPEQADLLTYKEIMEKT